MRAMTAASANPEPDYSSPMVRAEPFLWKLTVVFLIGIGALIYFRPFEKSDSPADRPLVLRASDEDSRLRLRWDPALRSIREAESAKIEVLDGGAKFEYPLVRDSLLTGSFDYARRSEDVVATLRLYRQGSESKFAVVRSFGQLPAVQTTPEPRRRNEQVRNRTADTRKVKSAGSRAAKRTRSRR